VSDVYDAIQMTNHLLATLIDRVSAIEDRLGSQTSGTSSVEIKTSTRGVDVSTKAYAGSPISEAGDAAMAEFIRVGREIEARLMGRAA
jgi:hypothetical protein